MFPLAVLSDLSYSYSYSSHTQVLGSLEIHPSFQYYYQEKKSESYYIFENKLITFTKTHKRAHLKQIKDKTYKDKNKCFNSAQKKIQAIIFVAQFYRKIFWTMKSKIFQIQM